MKLPEFVVGAPEATTTVTVRKRLFVVELYQNRRRGLMRDASRGYAPVAAVTLGEPATKDPKELDLALRRAARVVLSTYEDQYRREEYGVTLLEGAALTAAEVNQGLHKPAHFSESPDEPPRKSHKSRK